MVLENLPSGDCECADGSGVKGLDCWAHPTTGLHAPNSSEDPSGKAAILGGEDNNDGENPVEPSQPF